MENADFAQQHGYYLEDLTVGMRAVFAKTITDADLVMYAGVSGDTNPLHLNEEFAARTRFKGRIVHGMLTASLLSTLVGTRLPGPGGAYLSQELKFVQAVRVGDTVTAEMTVVEIDERRQRIHLDTACRVDGHVVVGGHAVVWVPRRSAGAGDNGGARRDA